MLMWHMCYGFEPNFQWQTNIDLIIHLATLEDNFELEQWSVCKILNDFSFSIMFLIHTGSYYCFNCSLVNRNNINHTW